MGNGQNTERTEILHEVSVSGVLYCSTTSVKLSLLNIKALSDTISCNRLLQRICRLTSIVIAFFIKRNSFFVKTAVGLSEISLAVLVSYCFEES